MSNNRNRISRPAIAVCMLCLCLSPATAQQPPPPSQPGPERPERIDAANPPERTDDPPHAVNSPAPRTPARLLPGVQPDGRVVLPNQWSLRPAGSQLELGDFPVNIWLHPREPYAAVLHAGHGPHEVIIVDLKSRRVASRVSLPQTFYGITFNRSGTRLFASGCEEDMVHSFEFADGLLSSHRTIRVVDAKESFVVTGITPARDDASLYVCGGWGAKVAAVPLAEGAQPRVIALPDHSYPYLALPDPASDARLFVSLWGASAVAVVDPIAGLVKETWPTPSHPTELVLSPDAGTLYVACANSTQVVAIDTASGRQREAINCALYPLAHIGNTPSSLSLSPDGSVLVVANADANNLAVFNVESPGHSRSMGFVPTGWYPTSVRFRPDGSILYASGKGLIPRANRQGPNPLAPAPGGVREYIGDLLRGTLGFVRPLSPQDLAAYTKNAFDASPLAPDAAPRAKAREANNPIPAKVGDPCPIKHCIYVIKENRTYDQILGDMREGNGDADLCIFPERVTPNHHALAREFVLLDNFYVDAEVSADGHEWSMAAYATDFVEKVWPLTYRAVRPKERELAYPSEGSFPIAAPATGYIWDRCNAAGVSYRSYGEFIDNGPKPGDPGRAKVAALEGHFDPLYRGHDLNYPDVKRVERFLQELARFEAEHDMPGLCIVRLPNDHTAGAQRGKPTPTAFVAENDLALGTLVEGVSKSSFWSSTAIFIVEDDAQNGSDHVDAHRTVALVVSPFTRHASVDSTLYSTSSILRTMELILGLEPMTQFDSAALPMYHSFSPTPDPRPYTLRPSIADLQQKNLAGAWGADLSETFDLATEDAVDDLVFNEVIWRSVRGPDSPMPPPVHAAFVFTSTKRPQPTTGDDDERK